MKGMFENRSALFQTGLLVYFFIMGMLFGSMISLGVSHLFGTALAGSFYQMHAMQFVSDIFAFLLPSFGIAYVCSSRPFDFLKIRHIPNVKILILAIIAMIAILPAIEALTYLNVQMHLPDFMSSLETQLREWEELMAKITDEMLGRNDILSLVTNIVVVGLMAGLTEEVLFRGALLSILRRSIRNHHIAIWIAAFIFSAIHLQFFGFIPRLVLGALLGYMLYWSDCIWVAVIAHSVNNIVAVMGVYFGLFETSGSVIIEPEMSRGEVATASIIIVGGLVVFGLCVRAIKRDKGVMNDFSGR